MTATLTLLRPTLTLDDHDGPSPERTDVELSLRGDTQAFRRLYEANVGRIHALVRRMMGHDHVEDVTQDVFVRAYQKLHTFRSEARFSTWLHRLAVNVILSARERLGKQRARFLGDEDTLELAAAPRSGRELGLDLDAAIARLPDGARMILVLHDIEGYRHEEIGELLGISTGTTKAQLHRARMLLRKHLTDPA
jgi:RNA polymerase sigma-70 factor (ECF subfamily)